MELQKKKLKKQTAITESLYEDFIAQCTGQNPRQPELAAKLGFTPTQPPVSSYRRPDPIHDSGLGLGNYYKTTL